MYGQMTAGSWIYIGTQGILQGTYETFAALRAASTSAASLAGRLVVTGGPRRDGRRAAARRDDERAASPRRRSRSGAHRSAGSRRATSTRHAPTSTTRSPRRSRRATRGSAVSIGLSANAAECCRELLARGIVPDVLTDQTSAHDALNGYVPRGLYARRGRRAARATDPDEYIERRMRLDGRARARRCSSCSTAAPITFDYGNNLRGRRRSAGVARRVRHRRLRARRTSGRSSARARGRSAGSRSPAIRTTSPRPTTAILELFPDDDALHRWIRMAQERVAVPGPAGAHLLARLRRARPTPGCVQRARRATGEVAAPIVIGRDHLDCRLGRVAEPRDRRR